MSRSPSIVNLAGVGVLLAVAMYWLAACAQRAPVLAPIANAAPQSPGLLATGAGPCGVLTINSSSASDPCSAATFTPPTRMATCENAGDVFEECW